MHPFYPYRLRFSASQLCCVLGVRDMPNVPCPYGCRYLAASTLPPVTVKHWALKWKRMCVNKCKHYTKNTFYVQRVWLLKLPIALFCPLMVEQFLENLTLLRSYAGWSARTCVINLFKYCIFKDCLNLLPVGQWIVGNSTGITGLVMRRSKLLEPFLRPNAIFNVYILDYVFAAPCIRLDNLPSD